jgi:hypothetical protein
MMSLYGAQVISEFMILLPQSPELLGFIGMDHYNWWCIILIVNNGE